MCTFASSSNPRGQDISKDAAKFVSDALDIYLQVDYIFNILYCIIFSSVSHSLPKKLIQRMISTRGILRLDFPPDDTICTVHVVISFLQRAKIEHNQR